MGQIPVPLLYYHDVTLVFSMIVIYCLLSSLIDDGYWHILPATWLSIHFRPGWLLPRQTGSPGISWPCSPPDWRRPLRPPRPRQTDSASSCDPHWRRARNDHHAALVLQPILVQSHKIIGALGNQEWQILHIYLGIIGINNIKNHGHYKNMFSLVIVQPFLYHWHSHIERWSFRLRTAHEGLRNLDGYPGINCRFDVVWSTDLVG